MKRRSLKLFLLLSCVTLLTSCDTVGDEIGSTIKDNLFPNIWATLAQIVATVLLFGAIFIFAYKPAKKYLNKRRELLDKEVSETKEKNIEADKNLELSKENITKSKKQAQQIIENAEVEANSRKDEIIASSQVEVAKMISDAEDVIKQQQAKAVSELKDMVADVALDASSRILEREVNEQDNQKIIDDFVKEVKEEKGIK